MTRLAGVISRPAPGSVVAAPGDPSTPFKFFSAKGGVAVVGRCTRDGVVYPGSMPKEIPLADFEAWKVFVAPAMQPDPDAFA